MRYPYIQACVSRSLFSSTLAVSNRPDRYPQTDIIAAEDFPEVSSLSMPKRDLRTTELKARLAPADRERFERVLTVKGGTRTQLARDAILFYLDNCEQAQEDTLFAERDKLIVQSIKSLENRLAGILVRMGIDIEALYAAAWAHSPKETRDKLFERCYQIGAQRFNRRLSAVEQEYKKSLVKQPDHLVERKKCPPSSNTATSKAKA
jgi:hypothetical protein